MDCVSQHPISVHSPGPVRWGPFDSAGSFGSSESGPPYPYPSFGSVFAVGVVGDFGATSVGQAPLAHPWHLLADSEFDISPGLSASFSIILCNTAGLKCIFLISSYHFSLPKTHNASYIRSGLFPKFPGGTAG